MVEDDNDPIWGDFYFQCSECNSTFLMAHSNRVITTGRCSKCGAGSEKILKLPRDPLNEVGDVGNPFE